LPDAAISGGSPSVSLSGRKVPCGRSTSSTPSKSRRE